MPVRHQSSPSTKNEFRYSATSDGAYDNKDQLNMEYRDSTGSYPDSVEEYNRFRFSDSAPHNTSHGSLDSGGPKSPKSEFIAPTRPIERKTSVPAYDPLQFIKASGKSVLAEQAKETVTTMKIQKEERKVTQIEEPDDWQSNLSSWKSKMRRKSAVECKKVTVFEEVEKQLEEEAQLTKKKNKTFKEMMEEREQRKGGIVSSYPMDDDDVFKVSPRTQQNDQENLRALKGFQNDDPVPRRQYVEPEQEKKVRPLDRLKARSSNSQETNRWSWHESSKEDSLTPWVDSPRNETSQREKSPARPAPGRLQNLNRFEAAAENRSFRDPSPLRDAQEEKEQAERFKNKLKMFEAKKEESYTGYSKPDTSIRRVGATNAPSSFGVSSQARVGALNSRFANLDSNESSKSPFSSRTEVERENYSTKNTFSGLDSKRDDVPSWKDKLKEEQNKSSVATEFNRASVSSQDSRNVVEKTIKITQNPGSNKGFGFNIKGGKESGFPITVQKVSLGSAADVCELLAGDEVVSVNGAEVGNHYLESVKLVLTQAARIGQVELVVKRSISQDPLLEDSFEQEEQMRLSQSQRFFETRRQPSMSPTPEQYEDSLPERFEEPQRDVGLHPQVEEIEERTEQPEANEPPIDSTEEDEDEAERERLDRMYEHTFQQPKSWETPIFPAYEPYKAETPPQFPSEPAPKPPSTFEDPVQSENDDAPPPLPSVPPPMPNWNTFPAQNAHASDTSFFDASDLLPDTSMTPSREQTPDDLPTRMQRSGSMDDLDEVTQTKLETVRRRSAFLGLDVYQTEEYQKIKEEAAKEKQNRRKEDTLQKTERKENLRPVSDILSDFQEPIKIPEPQPEPVPSWSHPSSLNKDIVNTGIFSFGTGEFKYSDEVNQERNDRDCVSGNVESTKLERFHTDYTDMDTTQGYTHRFEPSPREKPSETVRLNTKPEDRLSRKYSSKDEDVKRTQRWQEEEAAMEKERQRQNEMNEKKREFENERQRWEDSLRREKEQAEKDAAAYQSRFPWQSKKDIDQERIHREQQEAQLQRERERQRVEEERKKREEREAEMLKEKEEELRAMEDRIAREAEKLRIERDRLAAEKEEQRKKWNLQTETAQPKWNSQTESVPQSSKYTPTYSGSSNGVMTTNMAPSNQNQKVQSEYVYRVEHSPPEKLKHDYQTPAPRENAQTFRETVSAPPQTLPVSRDRITVVSTERKEETLVSRSPFGSTTSLERATPQAGRKSYPIQPKPNIKSELMNKPPSPIPTLRGSALSLPKLNPPPSPTTRVSDGSAIQLDRRSLHQLNQVPKPRLNENWVSPDAGRKSGAPRMSEVMRQTMPLSQHWMIEEAERRRLAESSGKERLQKLQSRQQQQQQQGMVNNSDTSQQQSFYSQPQSNNYVNMTPSSEAEPYIAALRQAGVYATGSTSGSQQSLNSLRDNAAASYRYQANQPKYPAGLYNDNTGYPANYQAPTSPGTAYYGGTTNPRPARPIPDAIKQTLLDRVNYPKNVRQGDNVQLSQSMPHSTATQSFPPQSLSQSHNFQTPPQQGPSSPAYAYPHQVKTLSSLHDTNQPYGSAKQFPPGPRQQYSGPNQNYGGYNRPGGGDNQQYNHKQPYNDSHPPYNNGGINQGDVNMTYNNNSYNNSYGTPPYSQYNSAPAKPPRTFDNDVRQQRPAEKQFNPGTSTYSSPPNNKTFYSPNSTQPNKHMSPNERSASDSSESAPPVPPKSAQLLQQDDGMVAEQVVSVAGHQCCAHCETELGQGAAMIIESLQLYYHVHCFRCCVCCAPLGTGERGADVRVRLNKLHCQNCYSNDEAGLKYSRV